MPPVQMKTVHQVDGIRPIGCAGARHQLQSEHFVASQRHLSESQTIHFERAHHTEVELIPVSGDSSVDIAHPEADMVAPHERKHARVGVRFGAFRHGIHPHRAGL